MTFDQFIHPLIKLEQEEEKSRSEQTTHTHKLRVLKNVHSHCGESQMVPFPPHLPSTVNQQSPSRVGGSAPVRKVSQRVATATVWSVSEGQWGVVGATKGTAHDY